MRKLNIRIRLRRTMAAALAGVLAVSLSISAFAAESSFSDVPTSHAFHDAVIWCAGQGIAGGYTDGTFKPANTVTRSNFTVMLSRAFYADDVAKYNNAVNLQYGTFYPNFIAMRYNGILEGTSFGTMDAIQSASAMNRGISRYDMAQLMTNIMSKNGFSVSSADRDSAIARIADYNSIPGQYKDAVANVYALGIITGYSDGSFGGEVTMNRGQAAVVIYRLVQKMGGAETEKPAPAPEVPAVPDPVTPEQPETPQLAGLTLRDGSAVTEANVLNRIQAIMKDYPAGTPWGDGKDGTGNRNNQATVGGYTLGSLSSAAQTIRTTYFTSMDAGCGGFASLVSDAIYGGGNNGGNNFPAHKLDSVSQIRPGDFIIRLDPNGKTLHVMTAASSATFSKVYQGVQFYEVTKYDGNSNSSVSNSTINISDDLCRNEYYEAWTRYPD